VRKQTRRLIARVAQGTDEQRDCTNCGAPAPRRRSRFCEYCGHELPQFAVAAEVAAPNVDVATRFQALNAHPELDRWMQHEPSIDSLTSSVPWTLVSIVMLIVIGTFVTYFFAMMCPPIAVVPLAGMAFAVYALAKGLAQASALSNAPLQRRPVLIVDERTEVKGGGNSPSQTRYFASIEFADGTRKEYEAPGEISGKASSGDMGIGFFKGPFLVDFVRLRV